MSGDFVSYTSMSGDKTVSHGVNPMLVTHFETLPQGGATLHTMAGTLISLTGPQWDSISASFVGGKSEPAAGK